MLKLVVKYGTNQRGDRLRGKVDWRDALVKMKRLLSFIAITMVLLMGSMKFSHACWALIPPEDLVNGSELILLGEIKAQDGRVDAIDEHYAFSEITWRVKVDYLIKGEVKDQEIIVTTPPEELSTHYVLGEVGDQILLFLNPWEEVAYYRPQSPQGVYQVKYETEIALVAPGEEISGEDFFQQISFSPQAGETFDEQLLELLKALPVKGLAGTEAPHKGIENEVPVDPTATGEEKSNAPLMITGGAALSALGLGILKLFRR